MFLAGYMWLIYLLLFNDLLDLFELGVASYLEVIG